MSVLQLLWLCHLLKLMVSSASQSTLVTLLLCVSWSAIFFPPSPWPVAGNVIVTPIVFPPDLSWGISLCCCCHSAFYHFSLCFLCSLSSVLQCVLASLSPLGNIPIYSSYSLELFPNGRAVSSWLRQLFNPLASPHGTTHFLHLYVAMTLHPQCLFYCQWNYYHTLLLYL